MKHQPIFNPHARIGQIVKKTKAEEKDELIALTKTQVLDKYGGKQRVQKKTINFNQDGVQMPPEREEGF